ncbi:MAG: hypothetical protein ACRC3H_12230 [Lachnospiraceae bacterium]
MGETLSGLAQDVGGGIADNIGAVKTAAGSARKDLANMAQDENYQGTAEEGNNILSGLGAVTKGTPGELLRIGGKYIANDDYKFKDLASDAWSATRNHISDKIAKVGASPKKDEEEF